jgi:hypothetical protein
VSMSTYQVSSMFMGMPDATADKMDEENEKIEEEEGDDKKQI